MGKDAVVWVSEVGCPCMGQWAPSLCDRAVLGVEYSQESAARAAQENTPRVSDTKQRPFVLTQPRVRIRKNMGSCSSLSHSGTSAGMLWCVKG